jgi:hypothetical protein
LSTYSMEITYAWMQKQNFQLGKGQKPVFQVI